MILGSKPAVKIDGLGGGGNAQSYLATLE
jgi:hypothetical protein